MSVMSVVAPLRRRVHAPLAHTPLSQTPLAAAPVATEGLALCDLVRGGSAVVVGVASSDPAAAQRLIDLGFVPGTPVEMVRRAPLRDPVVYRVAGYEIALRRAQAECIRVAAA